MSDGWHIERKYSDKYNEARESVSSELEYLIYRSDGSQATLEEARAAFTAIYNFQNLVDACGNKPSEFTLEEESDSAGCAFTARVKFASIPNEESTLGQDNPWWIESFDTSGGSSHVTYGRDERWIAFDPDDDEIPLFGGGIGWNGESFDGCDIKTPALTFTAKTRLKYALMRQDIAERFAMTTGMINDAPFCGFAKHCVQCVSVKGNVIFLPTVDAVLENEYGTPVQAVEPWYEFTCEFEVQPWVNITLPDKRWIRKNGYDYVWVLWKTIDDEDTALTIKVPKALYVNQVYPETDFNWFGLRFFNW